MAANKKLVDRACSVLGWTPSSWTEIKGGYTPAARYVVRTANVSAFVKIATTPLTAAMLRREIHAYGVLSGAFYCPRLIGWQDDDRYPLLVIEDLSEAHWPPPWNDARVAAVLDAIESMHAQSRSTDL